MAVSIGERYSKRLKIKTFFYEIDFLDESTNKRVREQASGFTTKTEARNAGRKREMELRENTQLGFKNTKVKFKVFIEEWLKNVEPQLTNSTWKRYKIAIDKVIVPELGELQLNKIKPSNINKLYLHCIKDLNNSSTTVRQYHYILSKAFKTALRWKIIEHNIMDAIEPPKKVRKELTVYNKTQLFKLLGHVKHMTIYMPILLSSTTGMRLGEVCGLRWKDVDLDKKVIYVTRQLQDVNGTLKLLELKTSTSKRNIPLLEETKKALEELQSIKEYNKSKCKNYYKDDFVVCKEDGSPYDPEYVSRNYRRVMKQYNICSKADIPYIRFHDLRHTYATLMLEAGVNPKVVSGLLGHSTVSMTLNTYSHILPGFNEEAAVKLENLLSSKDDESSKDED